MKAAVLDGVVVDTHPENGYECHPSITWVDCDDKVKHGWTYDGKTFKTNEIIFTAEEELDRLRYLFKLYGGTLGSEFPSEE